MRDGTTNGGGSLLEQRWNINANIKRRSQLGLCVLLTVSLFMNPQIAAATSQAKRITKKKKNYRKKRILFKLINLYIYI